MKIRPAHVLAVFTAIFAMAAPPALAQDWTVQANNGDTGQTYSDGSGDIVRTATVAAIEAACSCDLDAESGGDPLEAIRYGLSTLWLDEDRLESATHKGEPYLYGTVIGEKGDAHALMMMPGTGNDRELRVYLSNSTVNAKAVLPLLIRDWQPGVTISSSAAAPPTAPAATSPAASVATPAAAPPTLKGSNPFDVPGLAYPAPDIRTDEDFVVHIVNWPEDARGYTAKPGDPRAPRYTTVTLDSVDRDDPDATFRAALSDAGLKRVRSPGSETLEVVKEMFGADTTFAFGTAQRDGQARRFYYKARLADDGSDTASIWTLDAPVDEWTGWGGLAVVLALTHVHEAHTFTPEALADIRKLDPASETTLFEDHYTAQMIALYQGTMAAQMGTLNMMTSYNNATAICAGMDNCTITADGVGGYNAVID